MKFQITMKDPDGVYDCIQDAAKDMADLVTGVDDEERKALVESKRDNLSDLCRKWFKWGEYLTVEIDTEAGTCVVLEKP